ncbi:ribosomal protein L1 [Metschnikowia bicuspidata]|uniref:Ribosomal protein L1 n=1 Tax=Metschnikowia bicuspidata TaxID=27322 RepID=A0A4P9ZKT7_9ASCO|nr:ribosomal protein L1 [Metschnikowia bicuspidata]
MLGPVFQSVRGFLLKKAFSISISCFNATASLRGPRVSPKDHRKDPKVLLQRILRKKQRCNLPAQANPIYMDIPLALRYMRAAEVGNPAHRTTLSVHVTIIPDKGLPPLQGLVALPKPIKDSCALILTENAEQIKKLAASSYNYRIGGNELVDEISQGLSLDGFTHCFATPEMLSALKPVQRSLGVAGLMPTVKKGTVSEDILKLVESFAGHLTFRLKGYNLAIPVGRCDFTDEEIIHNIKAIADQVTTCQPLGNKKSIVGRCSLSSTNGPSVVIDFKDL